MRRVNFANHCGGAADTLFICPGIQEGIKQCQANNKKVLISLGGATGDGDLSNQQKATNFANILWNVFLGGNGTSGQRPFGE